MATKKEEKTKPTSLEELDQRLSSEADEIEVSDPGNPDDLYFEDGPLAGKRVTAKKHDEDGKEIAPATPAQELKPESKESTKTPETTATTETVDPSTPMATKEDAETTTTEPATTTQTTEPYKANTVYKVYDQEKQFPDWAKPLATTKESEENLRSVLQRSEAFDTLRTKHTSTVEERDNLRGSVEEHVERVQRHAELREKNLGQFLHNMGCTPKAIIDYAATLAHMQDTNPAEYAEVLRRFDRGAEDFNRGFTERQTNNDQANQMRALHQQAWDSTMNAPEVANFRTRMDSIHGPGAFEKQLKVRGSHVYQTENKRYVPPQELAQWVMTTWGSALPPVVAAPAVTPQATTPAAQSVPQTPVNPSQQKPGRVQTLPNLGRGSNASPTRVKPKSFAEMEKHIEGLG